MKVIYDFKWDFFNVGVWLLWVLMVGNSRFCWLFEVYFGAWKR